MARCSQCGAELREGANFCENCGARVEPKKMFCPHCGKEVDATHVFCSNCGGRLKGLGQEAQAVPAQPEPAPAPAPAPVVAPAPAPAPAPRQNVQQQPQRQFQPAPKPQENKPLPLARNLVLNIGVFVIYALMVLPFVLPISSGFSANYIDLIRPLFDFSGLAGPEMANRIVIIIMYVLPAIGFLSFGTIALVSAIKGIIKKAKPKLACLGYMFGMYMPFFIVLLGENNTGNGIDGLNFLGFQTLIYIPFLAAIALYMLVGLADKYLEAILEKKSLSAPIVKSVAAVLGAAIFVFFFGTYVVSSKGTGTNYSPMNFYMLGMSALFSGSEAAALGAPLLLHALVYILAGLYVGLAMGELFSDKNKKGYRVAAIVFTALAVFASFGTYGVLVVIGGGNFVMGMPTVCAFVTLALVIAFLVLSSIAANKEKQAALR